MDVSLVSGPPVRDDPLRLTHWRACAGHAQRAERAQQAALARALGELRTCSDDEEYAVVGSLAAYSSGGSSCSSEGGWGDRPGELPVPRSGPR